jgi:hypothetical protein
MSDWVCSQRRHTCQQKTPAKADEGVPLRKGGNLPHAGGSIGQRMASASGKID